MKKFLGITLATVIALSLATPAFAKNHKHKRHHRGHHTSSTAPTR